MKKVFTLLLFFVSLSGFAQMVPIRGTVTDSRDNSQLPGATVVIIRASDAEKTGVVTDMQGRFELQQTPGRYNLQVSFLGFEMTQRTITLGNTPLNLGNIALSPAAKQLNEVQVIGKIPTGEQKGDTAQYNASAFKTNPDANAEDLVQKMPGVTMQDGKVKAQGEDVGRVLVDGKEFFGNDAAATLRNLPAEVIDKIQVFDQQSEQSRLTGFNDGNTVKTINIVTRPNMRNGKFGKVYAGAGTDNRYQAGGSINIFKGDRRISILGQTNNLNQQNFSSEDLVGVNSGGGGGGRRGGFGGGGGRGGFGGRGGGGSEEFQVAQLGGITRTHAFGLNYSDKWTKKVDVSGSYFMNNGDNLGYQESFRDYLVVRNNIQNQYARDTSNSINTNHRFNLRLEYNIDSANSIIFRPRLSLQTNSGESDSFTQTRSVENNLLNQSRNLFESDLMGYNFSNELMFRHQFAKRGRSFAIGLNANISQNNGESFTNGLLNIYGAAPKDSVINQFSDFSRTGWSFTPNIMYTEPVSKFGQVQINYSRTFQQNESDRRTFNYSETEGDYTDFDPRYSNTFTNQNPQQTLGLGYRFFNQKYSFFTRLNYQYSELNNERIFPIPTTEAGRELHKSFHNFVPFGMFTYNFSRQKNLRIFYRSFTNSPSVEQLQDVEDPSNPLLIRTGNPDLNQSVNHGITARYSASNIEKSTNFFALLGTNLTQDAIVNNTFGIGQGRQKVQPVNVDGQLSVNSFLTYGVALKFIKSNLNVNASGDFNRRPGMVNFVKTFSNSQNYGGGLTLSSNISPKLDFTLSSGGNMTYTETTGREQNQNDRFFNLNNRVRVNLIFWKDLVFNSEYSNRIFTGLNADFNQNINLWNVGLGKKLFEKKNGDIRLSVFDALKQNNSLQRNIQADYIDDIRSLVLQRYYMLTFTYNIRSFGAGMGNGGGNNNNGGRPDGGGPRGPGGFGGNGPGGNGPGGIR